MRVKKLVQQNYQPAYDFTFSAATNLILDKNLTIRDPAQECLALLVSRGYLNQIKIFLAQFDHEFPNKQIERIAQFINTQGPLGKRNDDNYNARILPPEPKCQKVDQMTGDIEEVESDPSVGHMVLE